ncbi:MAG: 3-oxoacyl-ACP synthase III family protein [Desulfococcaceae bacterium]
MKNAVILSTGSYIPETMIRNEELTQFPQSALSLIAEKTGVESRYHASEDQCTSDLAVLAARNCLNKVSFPPEDLDGIIVSTSSPDRMQPATATRVQHLLEAKKAFAFDINSVCSGSTYGISVADAFMKTGRYENILFVAAELYSKILNKKDFSTFPYFGDAAGAILFRAGDDREGVLHSCLKTDGSRADVICVPGGGTMMPFEKISKPVSAYFKMNGKIVFSFAIEKGSEIILQVLEEAGASLRDVNCFICHQANINIIKAIAEKTEMPLKRFFVNLNRYGNTASASVPVALDEAISQGVIAKGDLIVTAAFGGGLSWGANLIRL